MYVLIMYCKSQLQSPLQLIDVRRSRSGVLWNGIDPISAKEYADMGRIITRQWRRWLELLLKGSRMLNSNWRAGHNYVVWLPFSIFVRTINLCILTLPQRTYWYSYITEWFMGIKGPGRLCKLIRSCSVFIYSDYIFISTLA